VVPLAERSGHGGRGSLAVARVAQTGGCAVEPAYHVPPVVAVWVSWPDWLGYCEGKPKRGSFLPFEEARELVRQEQLRNQAQVRRHPSASAADGSPVSREEYPQLTNRRPGWGVAVAGVARPTGLCALEPAYHVCPPGLAVVGGLAGHHTRQGGDTKEGALSPDTPDVGLDSRKGASATRLSSPTCVHCVCVNSASAQHVTRGLNGSSATRGMADQHNAVRRA
jgi:hypothetical protein